MLCQLHYTYFYEKLFHSVSSFENLRLDLGIINTESLYSDSTVDGLDTAVP
jgi:hypothetical protein